MSGSNRNINSLSNYAGLPHYYSLIIIDACLPKANAFVNAMAKLVMWA
jgi:hypothetical protein